MAAEMNTENPSPAWVPYQKCNFHTQLPAGYRYTSGHFWLSAQPEGVWRVGLTKFAIRMLGEMVDYNFQAAPGARVEWGQIIGSIECFKAMSDLYCVAQGEFLGGNDALRDQAKLLSTAPYAEGWLYEVRGAPDPAALDVQGYQEHLNRVIDQLREQNPD
jgi:glycine cleavage system H protein